MGKKIRDQVRAARALGADVRLFALSTGDRLWEGFGDLSVEIVHPGGRLERDRQMAALLAGALDWRADVAYIRYSTHYRSLERFMDRVPTVLELNTDDRSEYPMTMPWHHALYHRLTRGRILRRAKGFVAVTRELGARFVEFGVPLEVIANGIDLDRVQRSAPDPAQPTRALFVSSPDQAWQGVDKILELADRIPEWQFDLVGPSPTSGAPRNVTMHGMLPHAQYARILARADLAFGTLALHRKRMNEACALKVREYLAAGIPSVIGYLDTDFPVAVPFLLQLPNVEGNVRDAADAIRAFGHGWKGRRVNREDIAHLDVGVKERRRIAFLETVRADCR